MSLSMIVAMTARQVIGRDGQLPWHLPADLRRFRNLTMGHHVILGRKTYESIGRPLPGRKLVVLSRQADLVFPGARIAADLRTAVELCHDDEEPFCAGGQQVYRDALAWADRIYLTLVHADVDGDAYFPTIPSTDWELIREEHRQADERNPYDLTFRTLQRSASSPPTLVGGSVTDQLPASATHLFVLWSAGAPVLIPSPSKAKRGIPEDKDRQKKATSVADQSRSHRPGSVVSKCPAETARTKKMRRRP